MAQFTRNIYHIFGVSNNGIMGVVTGCDSTLYQDSITLTAIANYGYHFTQWSDGNTDNPRTVQVTGDATYTAYFDYNQYSITLGVDDDAHGSVNGAGSYDYLSNNILTATANYGYHFTTWSDGDTNNPRTLTLTKDTAFTAFFDRNSYGVTVLSDNEVMGDVAGDDTVLYLDSVTISATPNYGYQFTQWSDGVSDNPRQVVVTRDSVFTALFDYNQYSIVLNVDTTIHGTVSGDGSYQYLDEKSIIATPNYGYHFASWNDGNTENPRTIILTQDTVLTALFSNNAYNITATPADTSMGTATGIPLRPSATSPGTGEELTVLYLDTVTLTATANYGYHFTAWSDGVSDNPRQVVVTRDSLFTALFAKNNYTVMVNSADTVMGTTMGISLRPSATSPESGEELTVLYLDTVTLTATANYGYHFSQWSDGNTDNPRTIILTQDTAFTALFDRNDYVLTLHVNDTTLGIATGSGSYLYLDTVAISASCTAEHYHFVRWSDGSTESSRNVVITSDSSITALFAIDTHTVVLLANDSLYGSVGGVGDYPYGATVTVEATATEGYHFAEWSNGSRENPLVITLAGDTTLTAIFTPDVVPEIYMVTVQDGHNVVIWNKELEVTAYNIYREGSTSDVYDLVATIPYAEMPLWTDTASRPRNRSYRYRMTATDLYGYESEPSGIHKTMHLTISQGVGNEWNLVWTPYEGTDYSTYVIYRGTDAGNIQQIDVMPSNGNTTYTDDGAPAGTVYYQVGILLSENTKSGDIILSNIATNGSDEPTGIDEWKVESEKWKVYAEDGRIVVEGAEGETVSIYDMTGRRVATYQIPGVYGGTRAYTGVTRAYTGVRPYTGGVYLVKVGNYPARKVVVR